MKCCYWALSTTFVLVGAWFLMQYHADGIRPYDKLRDHPFVAQRMEKDFPDDAALYADIDSESIVVTILIPETSRQQLLEHLNIMKVPRTAIIKQELSPPSITLKIDRQIIYVYVRDSRAIAFVRAFIFGGTGVIAYLSVAEEYRGKGIGGKLLAHMVAALRQLGVKDITLSTGERNEAALRLYEKSGFVLSPDVVQKGTPVFVYVGWK